MEYMLYNRALHAVCEFVDDTVRYSMVSPLDQRVRPRSVQLPLKDVKKNRRRVLSQEPPEIHWRRPSVNRQDILKVVSRKMIRKRIAWKKIRYATVRIDCWNRTYRRPTTKRPRLRIPKIFYQPKPYDTWNRESAHTPTPRNVPSRVQRVEAKPRVDTWLRKPYAGPVSQFKIVNRPIQVTGKSRIDTWLRAPIRRAHSAVEVSDVPGVDTCRSARRTRSSIGHCMSLDAVESTPGEETRSLKSLTFDAYEIDTREGPPNHLVSLPSRSFINRFKFKARVAWIPGCDRNLFDAVR